MDMMKNLSVTPLKNTNLNTMKESFHEGIYMFNNKQSTRGNNFPSDGISGFLFINTDFDGNYCAQKIMTLSGKFFYRTGIKKTSLFEWSEWDRYASISDVPAKDEKELDKDFITKKEYFPKKLEGNVFDHLGWYDSRNRGNYLSPRQSGNGVDVDLATADDDFYMNTVQLDSVLQRVYTYYGPLPEYIEIQKLPGYVNKTGFMRDKEKSFLLGYFIRENDITDDEKDGVPNYWPTKKTGLLQVFSALGTKAGFVNYLAPVVESNDYYHPIDNYTKSSMLTTFIFHEFETGAIYVARISDWFINGLHEIPNVDYFNSGNTQESTNIIWSKYNNSISNTYKLNTAGIDLLKLKSKIWPVKASGLNEFSGIVDDTRNDDYLRKGDYIHFTPNTKVISWNNDTRINIINNERAIPYFNNNITDSDFSIISSLWPNGCYLKNTDIPAMSYDRTFYEEQRNVLGFPVQNTFAFSYSTIKIAKNRFKNLFIEKVNN